MKNIRDIKKYLCSEHYQQLSELTGYSVIYIEDCLTHRRNNQLIVQAAATLVGPTPVSA
jgi:hypothetical protein